MTLNRAMNVLWILITVTMLIHAWDDTAPPQAMAPIWMFLTGALIASNKFFRWKNAD